MKTIFKIALLALLLSVVQTSDAQILKKLKNKINRKVEQKVEKEIDKTIDGIDKPKPKKEKEVTELVNKIVSGSATIKHDSKYGTFNINEFGKTITQVKNDEVRIYGSWVTMSADIHDGYVLVIPNGQNLLFDGNEPKQQQFKFNIPNEAQLQLSYDPAYDPKAEDENGFSSAVTEDYQDYDLESGEVTVDVFSKDNVQITFSGMAKLVSRTKNPDKNAEETYILSYSSSSISGAIDVSPVDFQDARKIKKEKSTLGKTPTIAESPELNKGLYQFTFETKVEMTNLNDNETYHISYLLNPQTKYIGVKADMGDYSDEEVQGESIIVMDDGNTHVFVETEGMKMRMSQGMMGGQQMPNLSEQMANYDYTNIGKTGRAKTILGATCYEYVMSDDNVKMELWVAPDVNLPNWFVQNTEVLKGHIMEYTITSKDGNVKSETVAINDNISKTINPKEYKKMF